MNARAQRFCATRAQKNLRWLRHHAPEVFLGDEPGAGWESVIPVSLLTHLHRTIPLGPHGPLDLNRLKQLTFRPVRAALTEAVFNGTIYFVQVRFTIQNPASSVS